jgi:hypothetical protein
MTELSSVSFYKPKWTIEKAVMWLVKHNLPRPKKKSYETKNMYHFEFSKPGKYSDYRSKKLDKKGILLTFGLTAKAQKSKNIKGGGMGDVSPTGGPRESISDNLGPNFESINKEFTEIPPGQNNSSNAKGFQEVYPLSRQSGILDKQIVSNAEVNRINDHDKLGVADLPEQTIKKEENNRIQSGDLWYQPGTFIYEMMKSRKDGGPGFPFPTSLSTYSPMDWYAASNSGKAFNLKGPRVP